MEQLKSLKNISSKAIILILMVLAGCSKDKGIPETKARIKLGAYYFDGWAGKCPMDDGTTQNAWALGMPSHFTKKLAFDYSGRKPIWGWKDDSNASFFVKCDGIPKAHA